MRRPLYSLLPWTNGNALLRRKHRSGSRPRSTSAPRLESLEDRIVLTTLAVTNLDDGGPGSLRAAIDDANSSVGVPDVIEFAPEVTGTISLTNGQLEITDELTINGPGQGKLTVSGNGQSRIFDVSDTSLAINQLTLADGHAVFDPATPWIFDGGIDGGGAIRASDSDVSLEHVILENNRFEGNGFLTPSGGGAIQAQGGSIRLDHVTARNNEATDLDWFAMGGAVFTNGSSLQVSHSDFQDNRVAPGGTREVAGGAVGSRGGQTVISHSRFSGNLADGDSRGRGGAIMAQTGNVLEVDNSHFIANSAVGATAQGGAIGAFQGTSSSISNSQFVRNSAVGDTAQGGAIWNFRAGASMTIDTSSIVNNQANGHVLAQGGGVFNDSDFGEAATLTLSNTNINANQASSAGSAVGGGVFNNLGQVVNIDKSSNIHGNTASTSHDDVFGDLMQLDELLAPI